MNNPVSIEAGHKYLASGGLHCPVCGSNEIIGASVTIESGCATQEVSCGACGKEWTDIYGLVSILVDGKYINKKPEELSRRAEK